MINSFDIDGVIYMGKIGGVYPGPSDIIVTGRSVEEMTETFFMLKTKGITNKVYFNPLPFEKKTRESSGSHKAKTLKRLIEGGMKISAHFEDDPIQIEQIQKLLPDLPIIYLQHNLFEKENVRHTIDR